MIPLSLYITIELIKLGQVYFIQQDIHLYHEGTQKSVHCGALNITEDLGQVIKLSAFDFNGKKTTNFSDKFELYTL